MPVDPICPFCPENGHVDIIEETGDGYLIKTKGSPLEECYFIIPKQHITFFMDLPDTWQVSFRSLVLSVPWYTLDSPLNLNLNLGYEAGQRISHLHWWVIPRTEEETAPSQGKGMATLIHELNQLASAD